jgi:alkane 1-monooxygenase
MILLAYVPALWFRVMDPRVVAHYAGDVTRANLHPPHRQALLARQGHGDQAAE